MALFLTNLQVIMPDHIVSICLEQKRIKDFSSEQAKQKNVCNGKLLKITLVHQDFALHVEASLSKDKRGRQDTRQSLLWQGPILSLYRFKQKSTLDSF